MNRNLVGCSLAVFVLAISAAAAAQQPKKIPRIGYLSAFEPATESTRSEAMRMALRVPGYIEGRNIEIEYRYAEGRQERFADLAAELVRLKVDIIVVSGGGPDHPGRQECDHHDSHRYDGPWVDPVEAGVVETLARPGGNVTGLTNLSGKLSGKRLELLKEAVPKVTRVAILYDATNPSSVREVKEDLPVAARALGLTVQPWEVRAAQDFDKVFAGMNKRPPDGLYVVEAGPVINGNQKRIVAFALKSRLPSVYDSRDAVESGGLMYYGADLAQSYRRVATYIDKILKGAKPADLPVEQPTKFQLLINLKSAKQIGVTIPPEVLARATKIIR